MLRQLIDPGLEERDRLDLRLSVLGSLKGLGCELAARGGHGMPCRAACPGSRDGPDPHGVREVRGVQEKAIPIDADMTLQV